MRSAPAAMTSRTSSPSRAKSAESRLGARRIGDRDMAVFTRGRARRFYVENGRGRRLGRPAIPATIVFMPEAKKYSVAVTAHSTYLPDQSDEDEDRYVFAYTIRITNNGSE